MHRKTALAVTADLLDALGTAQAQDTGVQSLPVVTVRACAAASAQGLSPYYAGGQVARGGRAGSLSADF